MNYEIFPDDEEIFSGSVPIWHLFCSAKRSHDEERPVLHHLFKARLSGAVPYRNEPPKGLNTMVVSYLQKWVLSDPPLNKYVYVKEE